MCPHTNYFHISFILYAIRCKWLLYDLIDKPVLYIDSSGIGTCQISHKFFISRRILIGIFFYDIHQLPGF